MPRTAGSTNSANYHYLLTEYVDDEQTCIEKERYYKTQAEIQSAYNMKRCTVYHLINIKPGAKKHKFKNISIVKLSPPICAYTKVESNPIITT